MLAVVTHEDVPDVLYGGMVQDRRLFARDTVRFEGDIVAGVAALTPEIARQAAALVEVEYEPLPAVSDWAAAMEDGATLIHPDWESYEFDDTLVRDGNTLGHSTIVKGDADAAMELGRRRRQRPLHDRSGAGRADRAAGDPRASGTATASRSGRRRRCRTRHAPAWRG